MTESTHQSGHIGLGEAIVWDLVRWIVITTGWIPGLLGIFVRFLALKPLLGESSGFFRVLESVVIEYPNRLRLGPKVGINTRCWISARGGVSIGADTIIGPGCMIHSANHASVDLTKPIRTQGYELAPVHIGSNVWLGGHVAVLPGAIIGDNAIIGAGAVVSGEIPENAIAVGVPARVLRYRDAEASHDQGVRL